MGLDQIEVAWNEGKPTKKWIPVRSMEDLERVSQLRRTVLRQMAR